VDIKEKFQVGSEKLKYLISLNLPDDLKLQKIEVDLSGANESTKKIFGYRVEMELHVWSFYFFDEILPKLKEINRTLSDLSEEYLMDEDCNIKIGSKDDSTIFYSPYIIKMEWFDDEFFKIVVGFEVDFN
jgi:hypothetical protein